MFVMLEPKRCLVLMIDDDEEDYLIVCHLLKYVRLFDFELDWVSSYPEAKRYLSKTQPDIILLDYHLHPDRDGMDVARWLWARGDRTPILLISGTAHDDIANDETLNEIVDGYRSKYELSAAMLEEDIRRVIG